MTRLGRGGFTLLEMTIVIAVLAVTSLIAAVALGPALVPGPRTDQRFLDVQRRAIEDGAPLGLSADSTPGSDVFLLPDARAIGRGVDPLIGFWGTR